MSQEFIQLAKRLNDADYHESENIINFARGLEEIKDDDKRIQTLEKISDKNLQIMAETARKNPQNMELQESVQKIKNLEEQLSFKQKNEIGINQDVRQEDKVNKFINAKKLTF
ncbi:hypothetical protein B0187_02875 [Haemophilus paracuniculus]|uniref:Uncharacterized protein n=1 Tax=Haemophilus paracuniculus TaxID=734 RepID=A0A1T0ATH7_9PAST|nr:hypothetical protein [Haemophilus paracuniculus]OOR99768.1 hypothetical protein B0187_02875 [Haemophilus paracuniculus]